MSLLRISHLSKTYGTNAVLSDINLDVREGEIVSLLGPSGCGKSTLLRLIAGLDRPDHGKIEIEGCDATRDAPEIRNIAMVFQSFALYPHMTARENMALPLRVRQMTRMERLTSSLRRLLPAGFMAGARAREQAIAQRVEALAERLAIRSHLDRHPARLSGGQRQRVAIGRALIRDSHLLLLDEPLSSLDAKLRIQARDEIVQIQRTFGIACIFVTHDQSEAFAISDRVAVMLDGRIAQFSTPWALYRDPANLNVARFVGTPTINAFATVVEARGRVQAASQAFDALLDLPAGTAVTVAVRPEHVTLGPMRPDRPAFRIVRVEDHGHDGVLHLASPEGASLVARVSTLSRWRRGDLVQAAIAPENALFFDGNGHRLAVPQAPVAELAHG